MSKNLTRTVDIRSLDGMDVPEGPGVYIMQAEDTEYPYPWRKSRVFYIGSASNLRQRLWGKHRTFCLEIWQGRAGGDYYYPIYEYAAYHGCKVCWMTCEDTEDARSLENNCIVYFANHCGARPVANSRGAWEVKALKSRPKVKHSLSR
jgi:hypothetical protein